jgi:hypothetical protein
MLQFFLELIKTHYFGRFFLNINKVGMDKPTPIVNIKM